MSESQQGPEICDVISGKRYSIIANYNETLHVVIKSALLINPDNRH